MNSYVNLLPSALAKTFWIDRLVTQATTIKTNKHNLSNRMFHLAKNTVTDRFEERFVEEFKNLTKSRILNKPGNQRITPLYNRKRMTTRPNTTTNTTPNPYLSLPPHPTTTTQPPRSARKQHTTTQLTINYSSRTKTYTKTSIDQQTTTTNSKFTLPNRPPANKCAHNLNISIPAPKSTEQIIHKKATQHQKTRPKFALPTRPEIGKCAYSYQSGSNKSMAGNKGKGKLRRVFTLPKRPQIHPQPQTEGKTLLDTKSGKEEHRRNVNEKTNADTTARPAAIQPQTIHVSQITKTTPKPAPKTSTKSIPLPTPTAKTKTLRPQICPLQRSRKTRPDYLYSHAVNNTLTDDEDDFYV